MIIYELPQALQDELYQVATAAIETKVVLKCRAKIATATNANGSYNFSTGFQSIELDVTDRIPFDRPIRLKAEKPILPDGDGTAGIGANVTITLINTDGYISTQQDGSIIDPKTVQSAEFTVSARINGQEYQLYKGKAVGNPREERNYTTFTVRESLWDIVNIPVRCPVFSEDQRLFALGSGSNFDFTSTLLNGVEYYSPYAYFGERGQVLPSVEVSDKDKVDLLEVDFTAGTLPRSLPISKYDILVGSNDDYTLTPPTEQGQGGTFAGQFNQNDIRISPEAWLLGGANEELTGETVSFWTYFTAKGNPISIKKHILEWGFLSTGGETPTKPTNIPVDWDTLDELEVFFAGNTVYVSETNEDPGVYGYGQGGKPLSVKVLIEKIAAHVGCHPIFTAEGKVSLASDRLPLSKYLYTITSDFLTSHYLKGNTEKYTDCRILYGYSDRQGKYKGEALYSQAEVLEYDPASDYVAGDVVRYQGQQYLTETYNGFGSFDIANFSRYQVNEYKLSLPYYKIAVSNPEIRKFGQSFSERSFLADQIINLEFIPQLGLSLQPGDKFQLTTTLQPIIDRTVEVVRVNQASGGVVKVEAVVMPQYQVARPGIYCGGINYCEGVWCE